MQKTTKTTKTQDNEITIKTVTIPVHKLGETFVQLGITVDRVAGIFLDAHNNTILLAYVNGTLDIATKAQTFVPNKQLPALMAWAKINNVVNFEIDSNIPVIAKAWIPVIEQMGMLKDKYGKSVDVFYGAGYGTRTTQQYTVVDGKIYGLTTETGPMITSLRYDNVNGWLYGIALDHNAMGVKLVGIKFDLIAKNPTVLMDVRKWTVIDNHVEPYMLSISRVRYVDGHPTFVVNHPDAYRRVLTLNFTNGTFTTFWAEGYKTPFFVIGTISNLDDTYVGYHMANDQIQIAVQKRTETPNFLPLYL